MKSNSGAYLPLHSNSCFELINILKKTYYKGSIILNELIRHEN